MLDRALFEGGVQERAICILGVEFKNLKALKTASEPMRVAEVLIAVEQFLAGEIAKAGGHLERFDDDLTMAFLGSPLDTRGEHLTVSEMALRGVTLAKTILSQLKERHQLFESNSPVHIGIGVHVATIVVGWARLEGHVSWVAQGEGVELTRELARATEWDEILVGDAVMHASETTYELRRKEPMYSASTQQIVKIHSILDPLVTPVMPRV